MEAISLSQKLVQKVVKKTISNMKLYNSTEPSGDWASREISESNYIIFKKNNSYLFHICV